MGGEGVSAVLPRRLWLVRALLQLAVVGAVDQASPSLPAAHYSRNPGAQLLGDAPAAADAPAEALGGTGPAASQPAPVGLTANAPANGFDCNAGQPWSDSQKSWCCENKGLGCPNKYDCKTDLANAASWPQDQQQWCCENEGRSCDIIVQEPVVQDTVVQQPVAQELPPDSGAGATPDVAPSGSPLPTVPPAAQGTAGAPEGSPPVAAVSDQATVSTLAPQGVAGALTAPDLAQPQPPAPETVSLQQGTTLPPLDAGAAAVPPAEPTTSSPPFYCAVDFDDWEAGWSDTKKDYCCKTEGKGCPTSGPSEGVPPPAEPAPPPEVPEQVAEADAAAPPAVEPPPSNGSSMESVESNETAKGSEELNAGTNAFAADNAVEAACNAACSLDGKEFPCKARVMWAARHDFSGADDACDAAHQLIVAQCPMCAACTPAKSGCLEAFGFEVPPTPVPPTAAPSADEASDGEHPTPEGGDFSQNKPEDESKASTTVTEPEVAETECDAQCTFKGMPSKCIDRLLWAAEFLFASEPNACDAAYNLMLKECSECSNCSLEVAGCVDNSTTYEADTANHSEQQNIHKQKGPEEKDHKDTPSGGNETEINRSANISDEKPAEKPTDASPPISPEVKEPDVEDDDDDDDVDDDETQSNEQKVALHANPSTQPGLPDCSSNQTTWSEEQFEWCCKHQMLGCPDEGRKHDDGTDVEFDCEAGYEKWERGWSDDKKLWCCMHHDKGCHYTTITQTTTSTFDGFDCSAGYYKWKRGWSHEKKAWCCKHEKRGCPGSDSADEDYGDSQDLGPIVVDDLEEAMELPPPDGLENNSSEAMELPSPGGLENNASDDVSDSANSSTDTSGATEQVISDDASWTPSAHETTATAKPEATTTVETSTEEATTVVDATTTTETAVSMTKVSTTLISTSRTSVTETATATQTSSTSTSKTPYNCDEGYGHKEQIWTLEKMRWCCSWEAIGCEALAEATTTDQMSKITTEEPDTVADDSHPAANARKSASTTKRKSKSTSTNISTTTPSTGSTKTALRTIVSMITTTTVTATTPPPPWECEESDSDTVSSWSVSRKAWCCSHERRGCPDLVVPAVFSSDSDNAMEMASSRTTSKPYDCKAGFKNWKDGWSDSKKSWCCENDRVGCEATSAPYDCDAGFNNWQAGWSTNKKQWCCVNEDKGCTTTTSAPYDCEAGFSNWEAGWSSSKKAWCCEREQRGCSKDEAKRGLNFKETYRKFTQHDGRVAGAQLRQAATRWQPSTAALAALVATSLSALVAASALSTCRCRRRPQHVARSGSPVCARSVASGFGGGMASGDYTELQVYSDH